MTTPQEYRKIIQDTLRACGITIPDNTNLSYLRVSVSFCRYSGSMNPPEKTGPIKIRAISVSYDGVGVTATFDLEGNQKLSLVADPKGPKTGIFSTSDGMNIYNCSYVFSVADNDDVEWAAL